MHMLTICYFSCFVAGFDWILRGEIVCIIENRMIHTFILGCRPLNCTIACVGCNTNYISYNYTYMAIYGNDNGGGGGGGGGGGCGGYDGD